VETDACNFQHPPGAEARSFIASGSRPGEPQNALTWENATTQAAGPSTQPLLNHTACRSTRSSWEGLELRRSVFEKLCHTRKRMEAAVVSVTQEREVLTTLLDDVATLHEVAETLPNGDDRAQALEAVANRWLASAPGMRPSIAAALLGLAEPTVRAWARRGILRIRSRKPRLLLDPASVLEVRELVGELRRAGRTRNLLDEVYNRLADEQRLADPDLADSLAQMRRGEYIVRRPAG
jgi:hypothetical protein